jgi:hypothetical protein
MRARERAAMLFFAVDERPRDFVADRVPTRLLLRVGVLPRAVVRPLELLRFFAVPITFCRARSVAPASDAVENGFHVVFCAFNSRAASLTSVSEGVDVLISCIKLVGKNKDDPYVRREEKTLLTEVCEESRCPILCT